jgi:hypothetical protein
MQGTALKENVEQITAELGSMGQSDEPMFGSFHDEDEERAPD